MPEQHLVSGNYTIESNQYPGQLVTVGDCDAIVGYEKLVGGTQVWALSYDSEGYATFQGVSANTGLGGYIAVNSDGERPVLVYRRDEPSQFVLEKPADSEAASQHNFSVMCRSRMWPTPGWKLPSGDNGTQIETHIIPVPFGEWKFIQG
ncbi:hypothetical protein M405DRAFT_813850 [Rhizopogon salebrosus TDB-379]|nr:hypothetical protein M405DRAFT_813850 [Rhizopogon salebrosus TDB-379]